MRHQRSETLEIESLDMTRSTMLISAQAGMFGEKNLHSNEGIWSDSESDEILGSRKGSLQQIYQPAYSILGMCSIVYQPGKTWN